MVFNESLLFSFYLGIILNELDLIKIGKAKLAVFEIRAVLTALCFNVMVNLLQTIGNIILKIRAKFFSNTTKITPFQTYDAEIHQDKIFE